MVLDFVPVKREFSFSAQNKSFKTPEDAIEHVLTTFGIQDKVLSYISNNLIINDWGLRKINSAAGAELMPCILQTTNLLMRYVLTNVVLVERKKHERNKL